MIKVTRYNPIDKERWDLFLDKAKNGHFMFKRDYMEYHSERFQDHSLLFEQKGKLVAMMPANQVGNTIHSHGGLTFGGIISDSKMHSVLMLSIFDALNEYASTAHLENLRYKTMPYIYSLAPSDEDLYALFINDAELIRRDLSLAVSLKNRFPYSSRQKRNINKGRRENLEITEARNFSDYWGLLYQVLKEHHGVAPVHSLNEIITLANKFPNNIRLFETRDSSGELLAGSLLYINEHLVHTQYLANSDKGRKVGALDFLIDGLLTLFAEKKYFDFGISTVNQGRDLNEGLVGQKEGFGGRAVVHDFYELEFQ